MPERRLVVTAAVNDAIRAHGQETYPHECCGALVGSSGMETAGHETGLVTSVVPLPNTTDEGPRRRFMVRPSDYRLAEQRADELAGELLGFYHSHPDHPARPSQYDLDHAWPNFAYVIVAVAGDGTAGLPGRSADLSRQSAEGATAEGATAGDMTVWYLKDDRSSFDEGTLHHGDQNSDSDTAAAVHR